MRRHDKPLEISALLLVVYTSLIVGIAEGSLLPHLGTPLVVLAALLLSRFGGALRLNTLTANVLGLLAFSLAAAELFSGNIEARLLAGAHLISYLTWIVVLQKRQPSQYWWMTALCVLQTAIGAVLLSSALYGLFLLGFLFLALWTLALFSLHRSQLRFLQLTGDDELATTSGDVSTSGKSPSEGSPRFFSGPTRQVSPYRAALLAPSTAAGSLQIDATDEWLTTRFVSGILGLSLASVGVAFVFFGLIPRQWLGDRTWGLGDNRTAGPPMVGFSENVSLESFGSLLASTQRVLEVRVFNPQGNPVGVHGYATQLGYDEPLFRGWIFDRYENGSWSPYHTDPGDESVNPGITEDSYRQEYRLQPLGTQTLFAMRPMPLGPVYSPNDERQPVIRIEPLGSVIRKEGRKSSSGEFTYTISTPAGKTSGQRNPRPDWCLLVSDPQLLRSLREILATEVRSPSNDSPPQRARRIVRYLRDSGAFSYSLQIPPRAAREKDPVLEFLQDRRTGHCQYFATALALLLRADGIPSRIVGGFKGGEQNNLTGYFDVQQRHAHAWVEAFIEGEWITLDATPAARAESVAEAGSLFHAWKNYVSDFWHRYVIDLDYNNQRKAIYDPLTETANDAWNAAALKQTATSDRWQALAEFLSNPRRWFSWQGGMLSFVIMLCLAGMVWGGKRLIAWWRGWQRRFGSASRRYRRVEFYERFRRLCHALGLVRPVAQTQQEFAATVAQHLAEHADRNLPAEITADFYHVRFGSHTLTPEQQDEIDRKLTRWEQSLFPPK